MATKAQLRATNKYNQKTYEKITFRVKKGERDALMEHVKKRAEEAGMSINAYIIAKLSE